MSYDKTAAGRIIDRARAEGRTTLTPVEARELCQACAIPVPRDALVSSAREAEAAAAEIGFPVVMKIASPDILHKTEAGGVMVNVRNGGEAATAYETILSNARAYNAQAKITGVQIQRMLSGGQEVIVGALTDPSFGKVVAFGLGGVLVEVLKDVTFRLAPATI